jgi:hypothetical protein
MPLKRSHTEAEIETLADMLRPLWRPGDVLRPWLRQHHELLRSLVHNDWSWAAIAQAMTLTGITYRTGKPWNADWLQCEIYRARQPLKGYRRANRDKCPPSTETIASPPAAESAAAPASLENKRPAPSILTDEPEFQPASFIDWEATRAEDPASATVHASAPIVRPPPPVYDEVMARLLGKKSLP